jgi:hypothetical protein
MKVQELIDKLSELGPEVELDGYTVILNQVGDNIYLSYGWDKRSYELLGLVESTKHEILRAMTLKSDTSRYNKLLND